MPQPTALKHIGILSDTHGHLPNAVHSIFKDIDLVLHAGDVGKYDIIIELETIAPVYAVYGNVDGDDLRRRTEFLRIIHLDGYTLLLTHAPAKLETPPYEKGLVRIFGHTHTPKIVKEGNILTLNPGSCSYPRGSKGPSVCLLQLGPDGPKAEIIYL